MKTDRKTIMIPDWMIFLHAINKEPNSSLRQYSLITDISYQHLLNIRDKFVENDWITCSKDKMSILLSLTKKGSLLVLRIDQILDSMEIDEDKLNEYRARTKLNKNEDS